MKVLLVHAHENPDSFSSSLAREATSYFEGKGHLVTVSDLYAQGFNPVGGKHDFKQLSDADYYKYAMEQLHASENDLFQDDLTAEMQVLAEADALILNFPLWWFGMPAILKGWVDRVLAYGFAYGGSYGMGPTGRFAGKKAMLSITTGSPESLYQTDAGHGRTIDDILQNMNKGILALMGYEVVKSFVAFAVSRIDDAARKEILENYRVYLEGEF